MTLLSGQALPKEVERLPDRLKRAWISQYNETWRRAARLPKNTRLRVAYVSAWVTVNRQRWKKHEKADGRTAPAEEDLKALIRSKMRGLMRSLNILWVTQEALLKDENTTQAIGMGEEPPMLRLKLQQSYQEFADDHEEELWGIALLAGLAWVNTEMDLDSETALAALGTALVVLKSKFIGRMVDSQMKTVMDVVNDGSVGRDLANDLFANTMGVTIRQFGVIKKTAKDLFGKISRASIRRRLRALAERLRRVRAERIAVTEIAGAYNKGIEVFVEIDLNHYDRIWWTARDELVCPYCGRLDDVRKGPDEMYRSKQGDLIYGPPGHPGCRCTLQLERT